MCTSVMIGDVIKDVDGDVKKDMDGDITGAVVTSKAFSNRTPRTYSSNQIKPIATEERAHSLTLPLYLDDSCTVSQVYCGYG